MLIKIALTITVLIFTVHGLLPLVAAAYAYRKYKNYENIGAMEKAIALDPRGPYLYAAAEYYSRKGRLFDALRCMEEAALHYDGTDRIWNILNGYGALKFRVGSIHEAKIAFRESLFFMPYCNENRQAIESLQRIDEIFAQSRRPANAG